MILCCKTCGNCFDTEIINKNCEYCGGDTDVLFSNEEVKSIGRHELDGLIAISREKYKINNAQYNEDLWNNREYKEKIREKTDLRYKIANHMLTTGYSFENYSIVAYKGIISGESVLGTGFLSEWSASIADFCGAESGTFSKKLNQAKEAALERLVEKSVSVGGNAVIGIDFDYITFSSNIIGVIANGTSVIIEEIKE